MFRVCQAQTRCFRRYRVFLQKCHEIGQKWPQMSCYDPKITSNDLVWPENWVLGRKRAFWPENRVFFTWKRVLSPQIWHFSKTTLHASIFVFYYLVLPLLESLITGITSKIAVLVPKVDEGNFEQAWGRVKMVLGATFNLLWLLPLFIVSKIVCGLWFGEVADNCYFIVYGKPATPTRISTFIADLLFSIFIQIVFLTQCSIAAQFPVQGMNIVLEFLHCSLIHSWYRVVLQKCHEKGRKRLKKG